MELEVIINNIMPLGPPNVSLLVERAQIKSYPKGSRLLTNGKTGRKAFFIKSGLARAYGADDTHDITFWFGMEGDFIYPLSFPLTRGKEHATVELLEDSEIYEIALSDLQSLYNENVELANWGRRWAEIQCAKTEWLYIGHQFKTVGEMYKELIEKHPDILQRVPLGIIASYLGTTQVNLSRIRAKIR